MVINLDFGRNGLLKLKSIKDVKKWAQEERQAWNWLNGRTGRYNTDVVVRQFRAGWDAIQSILDAGDESAIKKQLNELYGDDGINTIYLSSRAISVSNG